MSGLLRLAALLSALVAASATAAPVRYDYQGSSFTTYTGDWSAFPSLPTAISGFLLVDQAIPPDTDYQSYSFSPQSASAAVLDFMFTDGVTTYTRASIVSNSQRMFANLVTDPTGAIVEWAVLVMPTLGGITNAHFRLGFAHQPVGGLGIGELPLDGGYSWYCGDVFSEIHGCYVSDIEASVSGNGGAWTASVVPLPAAAWLFGSALLLMGRLQRSNR